MLRIIAENSLQPLGEMLRGCNGSVYVVYDKNVGRELAALTSDSLSYALDASEEGKTLSGVERICEWLLSAGADRRSLILAVGGGITSDMTGFAASIFKRGVRYANVPTTLLSMVDAGIGGKTGVNFKGFKNMLGIIRQPEFTYVWPGFLHTLPEREYRSGVAEMLKTFLLSDAALYRKAVDAVRAGDMAAVGTLVPEAAAVKAKIVEEDMYETGIRRVLNLGHTFGHAVEWYQKAHSTQTQYTHGEAVAMGVVKAAELSVKMGMASESVAAGLIEDFRACGLPVEIPFPEDELLDAVREDKKGEDGEINFVFIEKPGAVSVKKVPFESLI